MRRPAFGRALAAALLAASLAASLAPGAGAQAPADAPRLRVTINDGWRFAAGAVEGAERAAFADTAWTRVDLPHTWNAADALEERGRYRRGVGWYRRALALDPALRGRRLFLHFEGANQVADVFVNGHAAGRHVGGYTAFTVDVTDLVRFDAPNAIAVRVDNAHDADIPPLNADFTFYGGIYRDVWLVATDPVHVTLLDHGSPGVYVDTPEISERSARVRVRGTVVNATDARRRVRVTSRVTDDAGREVAVLRADVAVPARGSAPFGATSAPIASPRLWSPESPALHRVTTEVHDGARLADRVESPLGFRWFSVDADRGLLLNGRRIPLHGTNRHQDRLGFGNALPDWAHREDVEHVKRTGFDFLRLAHYPQDPAVLEATDRAGLVVWEEIPVVNIISMSDAFADNAERMLVEMIRQHYNHPSVLMWGYMNEVMLVKPNPVPEGYGERVVALARRRERAARREDSTRLTVTAISFDEIDDDTGLQAIPDILGLNLYFGWYYRTLEGFGAWLDSLHRRHPSRPILISEYGAGSDERIHAREPRAFDFSTTYQQRFHERTFPQLAERPWLAGTAVWSHFDFGSQFRHDSKPNVNQKGLFYMDRTPKDVWFYYRARLVDEPVLHVAARDRRSRAGSRPRDERQPVKVYTNLDDVELLLGDSSLGRRRPANATAEWVVPLRDGDNRLRARGVRRGAEVVDEVVVRYADRAPLFRDPAAAAREIAVNAGSHYEYVDAGGMVWEADRPYERGSWGYVGGAPALVHHRIFGTVDDPLYQAARDSAREYRFDVPDGEYEVRLRLVETRHERAGERIFDVRVGGVPVFTSLDLAAQYGRYVAVERAARVRASGGGGLVVRFDAGAGAPIVSGIVVRRL